MGIYYGAFNLNKREWFTGHDLGQGAKWDEALVGLPSKALWVLLSNLHPGDAVRGRWANDAIRVLPDGGLCWYEVVHLIELEPNGDPDLAIRIVDEATSDAAAERDPDVKEIHGWTNIGTVLLSYLRDRR